MRILLVGLLVVLISSLPGVALAQSHIFGDWQASCDTYDQCAASTRFNPNPGADIPADQILNVSRQPYESYWEIFLETYAAAPVETGTLDIAVDGEKTTFTGPDDFAAFGGLNNYYLLGDKAQRIMDQMTPGSTLEITFTDSEGMPQHASYSLTGLTAALLWIDEQQTRVGSERVAKAPPANKVRVTTRQPAPVTDELLARHAANTECDPLADLAHGEDIRSHRMTATDTLHLLPCWAGAYNFSYMAYVEGRAGAEQSYFASYTDTLGWTGTATLVNPWFDPRTNTLHDFYKGRGLGDCGAIGLWQWADVDFKLLEYRAMDTCNVQEKLGDFPIVYRTPGYVSNRKDIED